ncbi:MAG TPA: FtsX-like permease family protein [Streptosporangiaceae bacterium]|nr:FtsX-like permease family protein [Streptosporangiaceae bacterium]
MFNATFHGLVAHRVRLALTALAVALGTGFMAASFVFTATLTHSLGALFAQSARGTDVIVQHVAPTGAGLGAGSGGNKPLPASLVTAVRQVPGVAAADGVVTGRVVLLGRNGRALPAPFSVALSWPPDAPFQGNFTNRAGSPPAGPGQVMIDRASARKGGFDTGDRIGISVGGQARPFTVTGITGYGSADSIAGGSMAVFSTATAQRLFGLTGRYDQIDVKAGAGVTAAVLRNRVSRVLPASTEAVTAATAAASQAQQLNSQLGFLTYFFTGFAGVSLFVGAFVIWNTFSIMVGQRVRELALLRTLGARRGQVFASVLGEAVMLGILASVIGVLLGVGLARALAALLASFGLSVPVTGLAVPAGGIAVALAAGIAITLAAALPPAWRATQVAPVQALRDAAPGQAVFSSRRLLAGVALTAAGFALVVAGLFSGAPIVAAGAGALACFVGVAVLGPLFARPLAWAVGLPLAVLPARAGELARSNAMHNPKRTSATAAALMIGLALIVAVSVLVASARSLITGQITADRKTSFYVQATSADTGLTPSLASALARVPGVRQVTEVRTTDATVAGTAHQNVDGVDPAAIGAFTDLGLASGSVSSLGTGALLVSQSAASSHHWRTGDRVAIGFGSYGNARLRIGGIFTNIGPLSPYLVSNATFTADTGVHDDAVDLVRAPASARHPLLRALAGYPGAQLLDQSGYAKSRSAILGTILNLITALLVLAVVIALLGIVNTLTLSVVERTRELGTLRAIGMRRAQLGSMIAAESVIIAVIGALLGTTLGLGLGAALAAALTRSQGLTVVVSPGLIAVYVAAAAFAGLAAAIAPARRAARMNIIAAIAAE